MIASKRCPRCGETKPLTRFGKNRQTKSNLNSWCKECCRKEAERYRHTPVGIYNQIKSRQIYYNKHNHPAAKPFEIIKAEFVEWYISEPKICAYCDIPEADFIFLKQRYGSRTDRLTVDCIDNSVGYKTGNLVLACERCNFLKSNLLSFDEMREFAQKYIKPKWQALKNGESSESIYLVHTKR